MKDQWITSPGSKKKKKEENPGKKTNQLEEDKEKLVCLCNKSFTQLTKQIVVIKIDQSPTYLDNHELDETICCKLVHHIKW